MFSFIVCALYLEQINTHSFKIRYIYTHRICMHKPKSDAQTHVPQTLSHPPQALWHHPKQCPITHHPPSPHNLHQMQTYEEAWRFGCLTLVTRSSKSTSRPRQSCQITHFIPIWGWSISAGPARLHYPQTSCEMAIMCVQACAWNGLLCRPSAFTSQQRVSYMWLNTLLRPLNTNTLI